MRILAFDSSNRAMSVALSEDSLVRAEKTINIKRNHSIQLMPTIEELIEEIDWDIKDIDRIVVAKGPGSYTGVRIAVTIAKTLAWTISCELVGISSLKALAMNANLKPNQLVSAVFDARRGNIYTGLYRVSDDGSLEEEEPETHMHSEKWAEYISQYGEPIEFIGEDVKNFKEVFESTLGENFIYGPLFRQTISARALTKLGEVSEVDSIHTFVPNYLKLAEAEEKWNEEHPDQEGGLFVEKI